MEKKPCQFSSYALMIFMLAGIFYSAGCASSSSDLELKNVIQAQSERDARLKADLEAQAKADEAAKKAAAQEAAKQAPVAAAAKS